MQFHLRDSRHFHRASVGAFHAVSPGRAGFAAAHAIRRNAAAAGDDVGGHAPQKTDAPHRAVAAAMAAAAAGVFANGKRFQQHRKAPLQNFRVGQARVGHVRMHRVGAARAGGRAGAAANRFVILKLVVAPDEVVHRALRGGRGLQRAEQRVHQALRGFHIAGDDRGRVARADHGVRRNDDLHRLQAALVQRDVVVHQAAKHIQHRGAHHRRRRVEVAGVLRAGAGEIHHRAARAAVHAQRRANARAVVHLAGETSVAQRAEHAPHRLLGVVLHMPHVGVHGRRAVMRGHRAQFARAFFAGRELRLEVGDVHLRVARRPAPGAEQFQNFALAEISVFHQQKVVNDHALLFNAARIGRRRAGGFAADVGVVAARGRVKQKFPDFCAGPCAGKSAAGEHRFDDGHIRKMRAAVVGRVQNIRVPVANLAGALANDGLDALAHGAEVHRHVRRVGDQRAARVKNRAGKIQPLFDVDRRRGVLQHRSHLLGDRHEKVVKNFQLHRVGVRAGGARAFFFGGALQQ